MVSYEVLVKGFGARTSIYLHGRGLNMDKKTKTGPKIAEIAVKIVALLEPLSPEDRLKVINGSLTMLGETLIDGAFQPAKPPGGEANKLDQNFPGLSPKGTTWAKQNGLTMTQLERVFDITPEGVSVIAAVGKGKREQTHNAYVLMGVSLLLGSGDTTFDDKAARKLCEDLGCLDIPNHAKYLGEKGNELAGSKDAGWKVTAPGLKHGAELVKQLTKEE
jgi:hypothetical protein